MTAQGETPIVIAPDVIMDMLYGRGADGVDALMLFDAIAQDNDAGVTTRRAYIASTTLPEVYAEMLKGPGMGVARKVGAYLLRLVTVVPARNQDYSEAVSLSSDFELSEAMQFVACRAVGAKYLVTKEDFGVKRSPVHRRTPAAMLPFFRR
jgi:hypothetical protein